MEGTPLHILNQVYGHESFRPLQEEIIDSVLNKNDTLALLPTGAGKSICYQIPSLASDGICLVISPLIALMKDQVDHLRQRRVKAQAIYSGMNKREIDRLLDNSVYGDYKFLFVSPERLKTEIFIERFRQMNVNLIAVDEAHCISQWGYDFRPQYLEIAEIRKYHPEVPILALTATATKKVVKDIADKLEMSNSQFFSSGFARPNLSFSVRQVENKLEKGFEILQRIDGSAIWYVRSRQQTHEISRALNQLGVKAEAYHAGLKSDDRDKIQQRWMEGVKRVIVCTNAFGMGIDKPDVRLVLHSDLPENIESYYQEAGRAGRDGKKSFAVLMCNDSDFERLMDRAAIVYPPNEFTRRVYQSLANHFQLAVGSKVNQSLDFEWGAFAKKYELGVLEAFYGLKVLEEEGFIALSDSHYSPSRMHFLVEPDALYQIQIAYAQLDPVIKLLLRTFGGNLFSEYIKIQEGKLAQALNISEMELIRRLDKLAEMEIVDYDKRKDKPQIFFLTHRYDAGKLPLNVKRISDRRDQTLENAKSILKYAHQDEVCRMEFMQMYFGEKNSEPCGICDVCLQRKRHLNPKISADQFKAQVMETLKEFGELSVKDLLAKTGNPNSQENLGLIREWIEAAEISQSPEGKLKLNA